MPSDESTGPLWRLRETRIVQRFDPRARVWKDSYALPETYFTLVNTGDTLDLMINQPLLDLDALPHDVVLRLIDRLRKHVEERKS